MLYSCTYFVGETLSINNQLNFCGNMWEQMSQGCYHESQPCPSLCACPCCACRRKSLRTRKWSLAVSTYDSKHEQEETLAKADLTYNVLPTLLQSIAEESRSACQSLLVVPVSRLKGPWTNLEWASCLLSRRSPWRVPRLRKSMKKCLAGLATWDVWSRQHQESQRNDLMSMSPAVVI